MADLRQYTDRATEMRRESILSHSLRISRKILADSFIGGGGGLFNRLRRGTYLLSAPDGELSLKRAYVSYLAFASEREVNFNYLLQSDLLS